MVAKTKRPVGRPSSLTQTHIDGANWYLKGGFEERNELIPSIAGLACFLGAARNQIRSWGAQNEEFLTILEGIKAAQEVLLLNKGLSGEFNSNIARLVLFGHGYSDKRETNITNSNGSLKPKFSASEVKAALLQAADKV